MDGFTDKSIMLLVQAGAVGIAIALILLLGFVLKIMRDMQKDHKEALERNSEAWKENAVAVTRLTENLPHICRAKERI